MNQLALVLYAAVNVAMVAFFLIQKNRIYEYPLWAGAIALGWFFPQAVSAFENIGKYPENAYLSSMVFATLCSLALWHGYRHAYRAQGKPGCWLDMAYDQKKLFWVGAALCIAGFFFQWKLMSLSEEVLAETQWSGTAVKYLFLASVFNIGFLALWLMYLCQQKMLKVELLVFIVPSLLTIAKGAILGGRRALMMSLFSYIFVSLWFARRVSIPRWALVLGLVFGLALVTTIGSYRSIMKHHADLPIGERLEMALKASLDDASNQREKGVSKTLEFDNYLYGRQAHQEAGKYEFGVQHWNGLVFNFVPAQLVGADVKQGLMLPMVYSWKLAFEKYNYVAGVGTTWTGYLDAFSSWGWLGFMKFWLIGWLMGILYRRAMWGSFLSMLLYIYLLGPAMHAISHGTQAVLCSKWAYFFLLGYPALRWAREREGDVLEGEVVI